MDQGWLLVILTSAITILGCTVVYTDVIYAKLFPKRALVKPFHIIDDTNFLVCSLSLSSGCLLFTSLYKLLPKAHTYFKEVPALKENLHILKLVEYSSYLLGILICSFLNVIIHLFTNESLVHCVHGSSAPDHNHNHISDHNNEHSHSDFGDDLEAMKSNTEVDKNSHLNLKDHQHTISSHNDTNQFSVSSKGTNQLLHSNNDKLSNKNKNINTQNIDNGNIHVPSPNALDEDDSRSINSIHPKKSMSLMDISLRALKGENQTGECYGGIDCCTDDIINKNHLHRHKSNDLHFCSKPSQENLLFFPNKHHMITDRSEWTSRYPNLDIHSPLISKNDDPAYQKHKDFGAINSHLTGVIVPDEPTIPESINSSTDDEDFEVTYSHVCNHSNEEYHNHNEHSHNHEHEHDHDHDHNHEHHHHNNGEEDHHHHIKTPLSRLLSIGLQTILAVTLHKFPEGFIMYSTSKTNPQLGLTIFLSMFIHNFVEGFTMTVPLYIALNSRAKALLISGTLGGLSQPIGALFGYYMFRGNGKMDDPYTMTLISVLLAVTSGFLTFISMQMFASAIGFGGKQEAVLKWSFYGITLICISNILI